MSRTSYCTSGRRVSALENERAGKMEDNPCGRTLIPIHRPGKEPAYVCPRCDGVATD